MRRRKDAANIWLIIGIVIIAVGMIGGIILTAEEKTITGTFSFVLMFASWLSCGAFGSFFIAVGSILRRLDILIDGEEEVDYEYEDDDDEPTNQDIPSAFKF